MRAIAAEAAALVRRYRGAYSGEHGDGLCRGEWIEWQFGPAINTAFGTALAVTVKDAGSNPVSGVSVTFTAPGSGASGTFSNSSTTMGRPRPISMRSKPFVDPISWRWWNRIAADDGWWRAARWRS